MSSRVLPWVVLGGALAFTAISVAVAASTSASPDPTQGAPAAPAPSSCADPADCSAQLQPPSPGQPYTFEMLLGEEFLTLPVRSHLAHAGGWTCLDRETYSQCFVASRAVLTSGAQDLLRANPIVGGRLPVMLLDRQEPYFVTFLVDSQEAFLRQWDCIPNGGWDQCLVPAEAFREVALSLPAPTETSAAAAAESPVGDTTGTAAPADEGGLEVSWATWSGTAVSLISFGWVVRSERHKRVLALAPAAEAHTTASGLNKEGSAASSPRKQPGTQMARHRPQSVTRPSTATSRRSPGKRTQ